MRGRLLGPGGNLAQGADDTRDTAAIQRCNAGNARHNDMALDACISTRIRPWRREPRSRRPHGAQKGRAPGQDSNFGCYSDKAKKVRTAKWGMQLLGSPIL